MKQAVIGIHETMGRHRNAVAPHGVLPQGKTPLIRLRTVRPRLRHSGMKNGVIPGIPAQQPLHNGIDHLEIGNGSGDVGVKTLGLRIIAHDEHSCLLRPFHARARIASGEQKHHTEHHEQAHGGILSGFLPVRKASRQETATTPAFHHFRSKTRRKHAPQENSVPPISHNASFPSSLLSNRRNREKAKTPQRKKTVAGPFSQIRGKEKATLVICSAPFWRRQSGP